MRYQRTHSPRRPRRIGARGRWGRAGLHGPSGASLLQAGLQRGAFPLMHQNQSVDGINPFPYENVTACQYRDEPACAGLQLQTIDADSRRERGHPGSEIVTSFTALSNLTAGTRIRLTQLVRLPRHGRSHFGFYTALTLSRHRVVSWKMAGGADGTRTRDQRLRSQQVTDFKASTPPCSPPEFPNLARDLSPGISDPPLASRTTPNES